MSLGTSHGLRNPYSDILIGVLSGALSAWKGLHSDSSGNKDWFIVVVSGGVASLVVVKALLARRKRKKEQSTHSLEGCLHALHAGLKVGTSDDVELRVTLWVPVAGEDKLQQLVNYVGGSLSATTQGRTQSTKSGTIGRAFRTRKPQAVDRETDDWRDFCSILTDEFGYTGEEARKLSADRYSYYAFPLTNSKDGSTVHAVVYLDCTAKKFFTTEREQIAANICGGISRFVDKHYA